MLLMKTTATLIVTLGLSMLFTGCNEGNQLPPSQGGFHYRGIYFGKITNSAYKRGIQDGCETARGFYTKSHAQFQQDDNYYNGWFLGRNKCRKLLRIDKNGDLIK